MRALSSKLIELLWHDAEPRELRLRQIVSERLAAKPPPAVDGCIVASYFFAFRSLKLKEAVAEIAYHATSGVKHPPAGSLLDACTAKPAGIDAFDATNRIGLVHVAFPLKMMLQPDGHLTSCDLLHTVAGAIIFDVYENQDSRLVGLQIPEAVLRTFPGPAHGPAGVPRLTRLPPGPPAFGPLLNPPPGVPPGRGGRLG